MRLFFKQTHLISVKLYVLLVQNGGLPGGEKYSLISGGKSSGSKNQLQVSVHFSYAMKAPSMQNYFTIMAGFPL